MRIDKAFVGAWIVALSLCAPSLAEAHFLQTDPIGYKDDNDLYAYVSDDPLNRSDPTGEDSYIVYRPVVFFGVEVSKHSFVVVTDEKGRVVSRYSYGPQSESLTHPGQLVALSGTGSATDRDDAHAWAHPDSSGVVVVSLTDRGYKDADVIQSGEHVNAEVGTVDHPGPTRYNAVPDGQSGDANSNSAARAVVQGARPAGAPTYTTPSGVRAVGDQQSGKVGTSPPPPPNCPNGPGQACGR